MSPKTLRTAFFALAAVAGTTAIARAQHHHAEAAHSAIPSSIQEEHAHLHELLARATEAPGEIGEAAKVVAKLLHEHFGAEERLAMPLLGLLRPLADHEEVSDRDEAIEMARGLRRELPAMMEEHRQIKAALDKLREVATHAGDVESIAFADALMLHARNEEEVLYPAALLVGDALEAARAHH